MVDAYLDKLIKDNRKFKDPFSNQKLCQELIYYPISPSVQSNLLFSDASAKLLLDYNLDVYSSIGINLPFHPIQKALINEGSFHIISHRLNHVIILGMYGVGKTSFLKQLSYFLALQDRNSLDFKVPVFKPLSDLNFDSSESLRKSLSQGIEEFNLEKIILLIDGMSEKIEPYLNVFNEYAGCIFASSYKNCLIFPGYKVFSLEPLPIPLQISSAQQLLSSRLFLEYIEKVTSPKCQFTEFCRVPYFHSYFLSNFEKLKNCNRANIYLSFIKNTIKRCDMWQELEGLACELLDKEITVFGFHEIRCLGYSNRWEDMKDLPIFEHSELPVYFSLSEASCSEIESELNAYLHEITIKDSVTEFNVTSDCHMLRFVHVRLIEALAAQSILNNIEDSISSIQKPTYIETFEFQKVFTNAFPTNFFFSRKYREVLLLFSYLCHENLFENLIKYLISMNSLEYCYIADRLLRETTQNSYQHLVNRINHQKHELYLKIFPQGLTHCSGIVRNICKAQLSSINVSSNTVITTQINTILPNCNWLMLLSFKKLTEYINIDEVYNCIMIYISEMLESLHFHNVFSCTYFNSLLKLFVACVDKTRNSISTNFSPTKSEDFILEENTLRVSLENLRICRDDIKESVGGYGKLEKGLMEILVKVKGIDLGILLKAMQCINDKRKIVRLCLVQRALIYPEEHSQILDRLFCLECGEEETIEFVLRCYQEPELKHKAKEILKSLDILKLKEISNNLLQKDTREGVLGLGFCCRYEIDNEILEQLLCYIDNTDTCMAYLGVTALSTILKPIDFITSQRTLNLLTPLAEIVNNSLQLIKSIIEIKKKYTKCVVMILNLLGDFGKMMEICEATVFNGSDSERYSIYKLLIKKRINFRYLECLEKYFSNGFYGTKGKYLLKIAELNPRWCEESVALKLILDYSGKIHPKYISSLLLKWNLTSLLRRFLNIKSLQYLTRIGEIIKYSDKKRIPEIQTEFNSVISEIESRFLELIELHGIITIELISLHGNVTEQMKEWMHLHILEIRNISELEEYAIIWNRINAGSIYNKKLEEKLLDLSECHLQAVINIAILLKMKSDKLIAIAMPQFLNKSLPIGLLENLVLNLLQYKDLALLISIHKLIYFTHPDTEFCYSVHITARRIIKKLTVNLDSDLELFLDAACKYNCSAFLEHVWKYLLGKISSNPRYVITDISERILKSTQSWDSRFTFQLCKIIGLLRLRRQEEEVTGGISTKKNS